VIHSNLQWEAPFLVQILEKELTRDLFLRHKNINKSIVKTLFNKFMFYKIKLLLKAEKLFKWLELHKKTKRFRLCYVMTILIKIMEWAKEGHLKRKLASYIRTHLRKVKNLQSISNFMMKTMKTMKMLKCLYQS
jgi:hypothetical protein